MVGYFRNLDTISVEDGFYLKIVIFDFTKRFSGSLRVALIGHTV